MLLIKIWCNLCFVSGFFQIHEAATICTISTSAWVSLNRSHPHFVNVAKLWKWRLCEPLVKALLMKAKEKKSRTRPTGIICKFSFLLSTPGVSIQGFRTNLCSPKKILKVLSKLYKTNLEVGASVIHLNWFLWSFSNRNYFYFKIKHFFSTKYTVIISGLFVL